MRQLLYFLFILLTHCFQLQGQDTIQKPHTKGSKVSFPTKIDINQATKDGIYLNGYVVNIPYKKLTKLNGKTVRISGKVILVKGNKHYTDGKVRQGRDEDTKHILNPRIEIINN